MECSMPFCTRIANFSLRLCCNQCKLSGGQHHQPKCDLVFKTASKYRSRSRSSKIRGRHGSQRSRSSSYRNRRNDGDCRSRSRSSRERRHYEARAPNNASTELNDSASLPSDEMPWCTICHESITLTSGRSVITHCEHLYCYGCWRHYVQMEEAKAANSAAIDLRCAFCRCKIEGKFKIFG